VRRRQGQASDIAIQAKEILLWRERLNKLYSKHTGQPLSVIGPSLAGGPAMLGCCSPVAPRVRASDRSVCAEASMERDTFMSAEEAVRFGLIDKVLEKRQLSPETPPETQSTLP